MTELEKMRAGELYDASDPELVALRARARDLLWEYNATREADTATRRRLLCDLFGSGGESVWLQPPFYCDYGSNIHLGERVYFNFNCVVLDVCEVRVGDRTVIGAGSVVTRNVPAGVLTVGNPARVVRKIGG